ncbi:polyubiquitin isoform X1 [Tanacetum coccineum]
MYRLSIVIFALTRFSNMQMRIYIDTYDLTTIELDVESFDTLGDVKAKICDEEGIPTDQQLLIAGVGDHDDDRTLASYNICWDSRFVLAPKFGADMTILIKTVNGVNVAIQVKSSGIVSKVKSLIQDKVATPSDQQILFFHEKELHDANLLKHYSAGLVLMALTCHPSLS